ncbi:unnamed protein product [Peniophora sp. CBMAI 1063]|nr:unnamed protein product [Peniophora sp. CBMAI 1063]
MAACAILTFVAHVFRAREDDRAELMHDYLWEYGLLWQGQGFEPLVEWEAGFALGENDGTRRPSPEFLNILDDLGLAVWLEANDDFANLPQLDTTQGRFLAYNDGMFFKALRKLKQGVRVHSTPSESFQRTLETKATLETDAPSHETNDFELKTVRVDSAACVAFPQQRVRWVLGHIQGPPTHNSAHSEHSTEGGECTHYGGQAGASSAVTCKALVCRTPEAQKSTGDMAKSDEA